MVHGEHNRSRNNGGFALIILGALLLIISPQIQSEMPNLALMGYIGGIIIGAIGFYLKFFRDKIKQK